MIEREAHRESRLNQRLTWLDAESRLTPSERERRRIRAKVELAEARLLGAAAWRERNKLDLGLLERGEEASLKAFIHHETKRAAALEARLATARPQGHVKAYRLELKRARLMKELAERKLGRLPSSRRGR